MHTVARSLRGSCWLAWLGLILAAHVATTRPAVATGHEHGYADRAATIDLAPAPDDGVAAGDVDAGDRDELVAAPASATALLPRPSAVGGRLPRPTVRRFDSSDAFLRLSPRPPPFSRSL